VTPSVNPLNESKGSYKVVSVHSTTVTAISPVASNIAENFFSTCASVWLSIFIAALGCKSSTIGTTKPSLYVIVISTAAEETFWIE